MRGFLGIDTSNYTTSAAVYDGDLVTGSRRLLDVRPGEKGLRQSDAVFQHVKRLPEIVEGLLTGFDGTIAAVGYSARPRDADGSYMPCFLTGALAARIAAAVHGVPCYAFSHQAGHVAAALYSASRLDMLTQRFIAFHVSGGTTEAVLHTAEGSFPGTFRLIAGSLDLKAGQAVDRVGVMLGLDFPAGPELERLALQSGARFHIKPSMKGGDCSLSGLENKCTAMMKNGVPHADIARYCLEFIKESLDSMARALIQDYGSLPLVFAGGVMSNSIIREYFVSQYGAVFARPEYSSDNAAGTAVLTGLKADGV